jgi:hypothetical protein
MAEIGYYNYYGTQGRKVVEKPTDWYQKMVNRYESDELKSVGDLENPYSDVNQNMHNLELNLADMAENLRTRFPDYDDADKYLCKKYFGTERVGYTKKFSDPEKYAMYKNDLNMVMYGTLKGGYGVQFKDPRLNYTGASWEAYDEAEERSKHDSISNNMLHLLEDNKIDIGNDSLLISIDPYSFDVEIEGASDTNVESAIISALANGNSIKNLLYYGINTQAVDDDALLKFRAYSSLQQYTGLNLDQLILKGGQYYTKDNENVLDLLKEGIKTSSSVSAEHRATAFEYVKGLLENVSKVGWQNMPDLDITIGYSVKQGFFALGRTYEV